MIKADKDNNSSANSLRDILEENEKLKSLNAKLSEENLLLCEKNKAKSDFLANISHEIRTLK
jgi:signal transduction histidine kinase